MAISKGDRVTFQISRTMGGVGIVEELDGPDVIIVRGRRHYRRPVKDVIRSWRQEPRRTDCSASRHMS